jgi:hypothetical protein
MSGAISRLRKAWTGLAHGAVLFFSIIGTFVLAPDFLDPTWKNYARFLLAVLLGLELLGASRSRTRKAARLWLIVAIGSVVLSVVAFFTYDAFRSYWVVPYQGGPAIRGSIYSDMAQNFRKKLLAQNHHYPTDAELVFDNGGSSGLWDDDKEIEARRLWLAALYLLNFILPASTIIAVTQFVACRNRSSSPMSHSARETRQKGREKKR